jgi:hypothetical protein
MQVAEFRKYDRNADGFITVEEVLTVERKNRPADRRGTPGSSEAEQPVEEKMFVLAGPGAASEESLLASAGDGSGTRGGPQMGMGNRGGNRGGPSNMGNTGRGGAPNMIDFKGGKKGSGSPSVGTDPRANKGNQQQPGGKGNRPGRGGADEE